MSSGVYTELSFKSGLLKKFQAGTHAVLHTIKLDFSTQTMLCFHKTLNFGLSLSCTKK